MSENQDELGLTQAVRLKRCKDTIGGKSAKSKDKPDGTATHNC
jgi:hypothetical protein